MVAAILFIALVYGIIIFAISRPQTPEVEQNERIAILKCWEKIEDGNLPNTTRNFLESSCREMEKQFRLKFHHLPQ